MNGQIGQGVLAGGGLGVAPDLRHRGLAYLLTELPEEVAQFRGRVGGAVVTVPGQGRLRSRGGRPLGSRPGTSVAGCRSLTSPIGSTGGTGTTTRRCL